MNDGWPRGRGSPPPEAAHGCTWRKKVPDHGDGGTEFLGFWLIHLNSPLRLSPDPAYERRGEWTEYLWRQPCGERMGHHTQRVQAANPGAVRPGQEEAQLWPPHSDAFSKREHTDVVYLIPEGENRTRIRGGGLGREVIKRQISAKKEQLFKKPKLFRDRTKRWQTSHPGTRGPPVVPALEGLKQRMFLLTLRVWDFVLTITIMYILMWLSHPHLFPAESDKHNFKKKVNIGIPAKVYHKLNSYPEVPSSPPHQAQSSDGWNTKIENLEM